MAELSELNEVKILSGTAAYELMVKHGFDGTYPTALKRLREYGLSNQPGGKHSTVLVERSKLLEHMAQYKKAFGKKGSESGSKKA